MRPTLRRGFTLIELLIVVVTVGVLAAIAIPNFNDTKRKAQVAAMKQDLRRAIAEAEAYFADNNTDAGFIPTSRAPVSLQVALADASRIGIVARHARAVDAACMTYIGSGAWSFHGEWMTAGDVSGRTYR